ncbi:hypothetical protein NC797_16885 [Aquibacillus sp. 3ASR75-11]|uniref:Uncharacterized protein n=1 Tax=Terrihalobacillus insolitus TaxID=2950438 RepID=A0A9X4ANU5_9BACI|nr:hypothetical protein [Terrihalobacillus insolitus]MDC3426174.1 hypothetical protein [Terrihalobacillus insolitus]
MKSRKVKEKEKRRDKGRRFIYKLLTLGWYLTISIIATTYWKHFGWWFLILCLVILLLGFIPIEKKLIPLEEKRSEEKILRKYPFVKEMVDGQVMTIEMKNGEELRDVILITRMELEIMIASRYEFGKALVEDDVRWLKLKKIKSIKDVYKG